MFTRILLHDWRVLRADLTLIVTAAVFGAALAYGLHNGLRWSKDLLAANEAALQEEHRRFETLSTDTAALERGERTVPAYRDPRNPSPLGQSRGGRYAILPPLTVTPLAIGQSDLLPSSYRMSTDARETVLAPAELENPRTLLTGRFDLSFVIVYLLPLLILVLSYNIVSVEKEHGTLPLALSQPVALRTLVGAKAALRGLLIVGLVLAVGLLGLVVARAATADGDTAARLALWSLVVIAYAALWFGVALTVAALGKPSSTNAMLLAGAWLVAVIILPAAINLAVTTLYPVPSRVRMVQAVRLASDEATAEGSKLLARYYEDHPELVSSADRATTDFNALRVAVNTEVERRVRPVVDQYERQLAAQQRSVALLRYLSPAILAQDALSDLAGTGAARHRHFVSLVDGYHRQWREFFVPLVLAKARVTDHAAIPRFTYVEEPFSSVLGRTLRNVAALGVLAAAFALFGLARLRRFPVAG
jgi:ABC-2 type transport system permease protein